MNNENPQSQIKPSPQSEQRYSGTGQERPKIIASEFVKFTTEKFIVRKKAITACLHVPADEKNPSPVTIVFWDHYSQEIPDPNMTIYLWIETVLLKPDEAQEAV